MLRRIARWVAEGGEVLISVPNSSHYSVLKQLFLHRDWKYEDGGLFDRGHYRIFTRKSLLKLLQQQEFQVIEVSAMRPLTGKLRPISGLLRLLARLFPFLDDYLAQQWLVRARLRERTES